MTIDRRTSVGDLPHLLRVGEVASWADVSKGTVYEALRRGDLPTIHIGRLVRVPRSALAAWVGETEQERTA